MIQNLFKDQEVQNKIVEKGWVTMQYLNTEEIEFLKEFYFKNTSNNSLSGFHATMFHKDKIYKQKVNEIIQNTINHKFSNCFSDDYKLLYANFMVKEKGLNSKMKWHQDWSYVHENQYNSYAIWIPLQDLNENNGVFTIAEESHKLNNFVRGPGVEDSFISEKWINENFKINPLYLKAGEAVIWHHRLLHASPPNMTDIPRVSATAIILPKLAENIHFYRYKNEKFIREYSVTPDFYIDNDISELPRAKLNKKFFFDYSHSLNSQIFDKFNTMNRIKRLFSK